jgi:hypothetical protein
MVRVERRLCSWVSVFPKKYELKKFHEFYYRNFILAFYDQFGLSLNIKPKIWTCRKCSWFISTDLMLIFRFANKNLSQNYLSSIRYVLCFVDYAVFIHHTADILMHLSTPQVSSFRTNHSSNSTHVSWLPDKQVKQRNLYFIFNHDAHLDHGTADKPETFCLCVAILQHGS